MKYIGLPLDFSAVTVQRADFPSFTERGGVSPLPEVGHCDRSLNYSAVSHALQPDLVLRWSDVRRAERLRLLCGLSRAAPLTWLPSDPDDDDLDGDDIDDEDASDDFDDEDASDFDLDDDELYDALSPFGMADVPHPIPDGEGSPGEPGDPSRLGSGAFARPRSSNTGVRNTKSRGLSGPNSDSVRK